MASDWDRLYTDGQAAFQQGHYRKAESLLLAAMDVAQRFAAQDPRLGTTLHHLARLYRSLKRYPEAEELCSRALALREHALGSNHPEVARSLHNLAVLHSLQGRYTEADPLFRRALAILEAAHGHDEPELAVVLDNYARMLASRAEAIRGQATRGRSGR